MSTLVEDLNAAERALKRQDAELEDVKQALADLGPNVGLHIPPTWFEDFEAASAPSPSAPVQAPPIAALRA